MTDKAAVLASLDADLAAMNTDYHAASSDAADVLGALLDYLTGTQPKITGTALAEVAYAFLAGYEHATGNTSATRPIFALLRKAGMDL